MKSTSTILALASAATLSSSPHAVAAIDLAFALDGCGDGDPPFINLDVDVACNNGDGGDSSDCTFGDTAVVEGTVYARRSFSDDNVTMEACLLDRYCPSAYARDAGTLCDWLVPTDGQDMERCGDAGNYAVSGGGRIPGSKYLIGFSRMITVRIGVDDGGCGASDDDDGSEEGEEASSSAQRLSFAFEFDRVSLSTVGGALAALAAVACAARGSSGRRRRANRFDDLDDRRRGGRYVEMADSNDTSGAVAGRYAEMSDSGGTVV